MEKFFKESLVASSLAIVLFLAMSIAAIAQDNQGPPPPPDGQPAPGAPPALTPEQRAQQDALFSDYFQKVRPLRQDLYDQRLIYEALVGNPNAKLEDIQAVVKEMHRLRDELYKHRVDFDNTYNNSGLPHMRGSHWGPGAHFDDDGCGGSDGYGFRGGRHHGDGDGRGHDGYRDRGDRGDRGQGRHGRN